MNRISCCFLAAMLMVGCSEDKKDDKGPPPPDKLIISLSAQSITVQRGTQASVGVGVVSTGSPRVVQLSFTSQSLNLSASFSRTQMNTDEVSLFTFTPDLSSQVGSGNQIVLTATSGSETVSTILTVGITDVPVQAANFLHLSQQQIVVQRGKSASVGVSVVTTGTPVSGNMSLETPGPTFAGAFVPAQVSTGGGVSLLTVTVGDSTPIGNGYALTVRVTPASGPAAFSVLTVDVVDSPVQTTNSIRLSQQRVTVQRGILSSPVGVSISTTGTPEAGTLSFTSPVPTVTGAFVPVQVSTGGGVSVFTFTPRSDTPVGSNFLLTISVTPVTGPVATTTLIVDIVDVAITNDFSVSATQTSFSLLPGQSTQPFAVATQVTLGNPIDLTWSFASTPPGITGTLNPAAFRSGNSTNAVLTAGANVTRGTAYTVVLTVSGPSGVPSHSAQPITVTIPPLPGPSDHTVTVVDPSTPFVLDPSGVFTVAVNTSATSGTANILSFTLEMDPAGCLSGSFNPVTATAGTTTVLSGQVASSALAGVCNVTVRATDTADGHSRTDSFPVTVKCSAGQSCPSGQICGASLVCVVPGATQPFLACSDHAQCLSGLCLSGTTRVCAPPPVFMMFTQVNARMSQWNDSGALLNEDKFSTSLGIPVVSNPLSRVAAVTAPGTALTNVTCRSYCSNGFVQCRQAGDGSPLWAWDFCATVP